MTRVSLLGARFDPLTLQGTVDRVIELVEARERGYACTVNVAILMMLQSNRRLRRIVERANLVVADGQPLVWASGFLADRLPERVAGVDLVEAIAAKASEKDLGIYLLGGRAAVVEVLADTLMTKYPSLRVCGTDDGYFSTADAEMRARKIAASGADILFVGMGVPRQEYFIEENWDRLGVRFAVGVGGSFNVIAGVRRRAPRLLQQIGLEWLFRLAQEPRRLWKRYFLTNSQFLLRCGRELFGKNGSSEYADEPR